METQVFRTTEAKSCKMYQYWNLGCIFPIKSSNITTLSIRSFLIVTCSNAHAIWRMGHTEVHRRWWNSIQIWFTPRTGCCTSHPVPFFSMELTAFMYKLQLVFLDVGESIAGSGDCRESSEEAEKRQLPRAIHNGLWHERIRISPTCKLHL